MSVGVSETSIAELSKFVSRQMGLYFPKERWQDLERGIQSAAREFGFENNESCIQWLLDSSLTKTQIEVLASHLTIGETYFFREKKSFEILEEHILSRVVPSRREKERSLRLWSAGCCTGEEPYSLAITLKRVIPDIQRWNITLLATDINPHFLRKAKQGVYHNWSFREVPPWVKTSYFTKTQEGYFEIFPSIQTLVTFSYLNLAEDVYPSLLNNTNAMDIIFCRNVLMYFTPECAKRTIHNLYNSLVEGGWLIVSPSETSHVLFSQFEAVTFSGVTFYRKRMDPHKTEQIKYFYPRIDFEEEKSLIPVVFDDFPALQLPLDPLNELKETALNHTEELPANEPHATGYDEAASLCEQGLYTEALEKIMVLMLDQSNDTRLIILLAKIYANRGELAEAEDWCEKAIADKKTNPVAWFLLGTILQERGRAGEAVASLKRALYLDQNFIPAHVALGNLTLRLGKTAEAGRHFRNTVELLRKHRSEEIVPETGGVTAGRLIQIIETNFNRISIS